MTHFDTHRGGHHVTLLKRRDMPPDALRIRVPNDARERVINALRKAFPSQNWDAAATQREFEIVGRDAHRRVLDALNSSEEMEPKHMSKHEDQLSALETQLDKLEETVLKRPVRAPSYASEDPGPAGYDDLRDDAEAEADADDDDNEESLDDFARKIASREKVSRTEALTRARLRRPDLLSDPVTKSAASYDELLKAEIKKGCLREAAAARVALLYPEAAKAQIAKSESDVSAFMRNVDQTMRACGCSRTVAMQKVRKEAPEAFDRFQNV